MWEFARLFLLSTRTLDLPLWNQMGKRAFLFRRDAYTPAIVRDALRQLNVKHEKETGERGNLSARPQTCAPGGEAPIQ